MPRRTGTERLEARKARLERHASETDPGVVLNAAARFLELRSRSVDEVRKHLTAAAFPPPLVEGAIERLLQLGWLDDRAFATAWVESRDRARPRGQVALRRELALKGIDRETADDVLAQRDEAGRDDADGESGTRSRGGSADEIAAERLLTKSRGALQRIDDPRLRRQRVYALLARNGFDPDVCREVSIRFATPDAGLDD
ncbi:MAG: regulatory protein RecX [Candidatus Limnocylindrales bacterium]|jgi:regulatory protein